MYKRILYKALFLILIPIQTYAQGQIFNVKNTENTTILLSPNVFTELPKEVKAYLSDNGYKIPQCWCYSEPHNVISGSFINKDQVDWAVIGYVDFHSYLLVFSEGKTDSIYTVNKHYHANLEPESDSEYKRFYKYINKAGSASIKFFYETHGGPEPPENIDKNAIEVHHPWKASYFLYYLDGKWKQFTGGD